MKKIITIEVDTDLYDKFSIALGLAEETQDDAVENCMRWYIAKTFKNASKTYKAKASVGQLDNKDFNGKAIRKIPVWALKPTQYNHKIIRAYFEAVDIAGEATLPMMERLCSDIEHPELFVPTFRNNYSQMKADGPRTHGKVFEDDGQRVWIWSEVEETLLKYKSSFYQREE